MLGQAWEVRSVLGLSMGGEEDDMEVRRVLGQAWEVMRVLEVMSMLGRV